MEEESEVEDSEMVDEREASDSESEIEDDFVSDQEQYGHLDPK